MYACKNCGSTNAVDRVQESGKTRWWCVLCGYWADRKKPNL